MFIDRQIAINKTQISTPFCYETGSESPSVPAPAEQTSLLSLLAPFQPTPAGNAETTQTKAHLERS